MRLPLSILTAALTASTGGCRRSATPAERPVAVERLRPAEQGFYSKVARYAGIPIKAHEDVADEALVAAASRLARMLDGSPAIRANLEDEGVELHVIGKWQQPSDLPENRHWKGRPFDGQKTIDERTRGTGGRLSSCGEENLLGLPGDRYEGRDICVHELAHAVLNLGLSEDLTRRVVEQHQRSIAAGRWRTMYAAKSPDEFFAELSMWLFGTHGDVGQLRRPWPGRGRGWLRAYDPEAFSLLDGIYGGQLRASRRSYAPLAPLPVEREGALRSLQSTQPTRLRFDNRSGQELSLHWLDFRGQRQLYGTIAPGHRHTQLTFATHVWVFVDRDGRAVALFVAEPSNAVATVQGPPQPSRF